MKRTWKGTGKTYKGSNDSDQLTVKGSNNTVNALSGKKDTIKIAAGHRHTINGGNGVDVITVSKGNYHTINGDKGNDSITLKNKGWDGSSWGGYWDPKDVTYGGADNDTIKVYAGRHEIHGGSGNDSITLYGNTEDRNEIYGDAGNDKITVKGGNYHEIWAGSSTKKKKDVISIEKGNGITVHGEEGIDEIKVTSGSKHTLYGDAGNDIFSVKKASEVKMYGDVGKDKFTINGGSNHTIETGDGNDTVTINSGSGHTINNTGNGGNDSITINKNAGDNIRVNGHNSANENVKVYGGTGHYISLGNGDNIVKIAGGINHSVYTGDNNDIITVTGSKTHVNNIRTGAGDDKITIEKGALANNNLKNLSDYSIQAGDGNDTVTIKADAGNGSYVRTDNGDDRIYVRGGSGHTIYVGGGRDYIEITGGSDHNIQLETGPIGSGENTVIVSAKNITLNTDKYAADSISVNWGQDRGLYTIAATKNSSIADVDSLVINNAKSTDFTFTYTRGAYGMWSDLLLTSSNGKILINKWNYGGQNGFDGITFADGKMSFDAINNQATEVR